MDPLDSASLICGRFRIFFNQNGNVWCVALLTRLRRNPLDLSYIVFVIKLG